MRSVPRYAYLRSSGWEILEEWQQPHALALYFLYKDLDLFSQTPVTDRGSLFSRSRSYSGAPEAVRESVEVIEAALANPTGVAPAVMAEAVDAVSRCAQAQGAMRTAALLADVAVRLHPACPVLIERCARLARDRAEYVRARLWYAVLLDRGRATADGDVLWQAYTGRAMVAAYMGDTPRACRLLEKAMSAARTAGLREREAGSAHDLMNTHRAAGMLEEAEKAGAVAMTAYSPNSPSYHAFLCDLAALQLDQGEFRYTYPLLRWLAARFEIPAERIWVNAFLARATAGSGRTDEYAECAARVWDLLDAVPADAPYALLELAKAGVAIADRRGASLAAVEARARAAARGDEAATRRANSTLLAINQQAAGAA